MMVEEFLELCRRLRAGGFAQPLVLLTSNPHDFCHGTRRTLHPELEAEFTAVNLLFCMNWPQATRLLTI
jgi:hypothetical protein